MWLNSVVSVGKWKWGLAWHVCEWSASMMLINRVVISISWSISSRHIWLLPSRVIRPLDMIPYVMLRMAIREKEMSAREREWPNKRWPKEKEGDHTQEKEDDHRRKKMIIHEKEDGHTRARIAQSILENNIILCHVVLLHSPSLLPARNITFPQKTLPSSQIG